MKIVVNNSNPPTKNEWQHVGAVYLFLQFKLLRKRHYVKTHKKPQHIYFLNQLITQCFFCVCLRLCVSTVCDPRCNLVIYHPRCILFSHSTIDTSPTPFSLRLPSENNCVKKTKQNMLIRVRVAYVYSV